MKRHENTISVIHRLVTDNKGENYWFEGCARYVMECFGEKDYDYCFFAGLTGDVFTQHYTYTRYSGDGMSSYRMAEDPKQFIKDIFFKCGYDAVFVSGEELRQDPEKYLDLLLSYIDRGIPVMDWSKTDGVYVGYEEQGRVLLRIRGNSDQPEQVTVDDAIQGSRGWAFVGEKKETLSLAGIYRNAVAGIPTYFAVRTDKYCFGPEAFRAWAADIENGKFDRMTAEEFDEWSYYTNYVCVLATNSGGSRGFLDKAKALNPDLEWLDKVVELYRRTGYMWNDENGEDLEAIGGGFNITLATLQDPEHRGRIAAKIREFAQVYDEIARVIKEGFASLKIQTKENAGSENKAGGSLLV